MLKTILCLFIILNIFIGTCSAYNPKNACKGKTAKAIEIAINQYLNQNPGLKAHEVQIIQKECVDNFAAARLHPKKPVTDDAIIYLQKDKNIWKVLTLGTDFDADFLAKLPAELR